MYFLLYKFLLSLYCRPIGSMSKMSLKLSTSAPFPVCLTLPVFCPPHIRLLIIYNYLCISLSAFLFLTLSLSLSFSHSLFLPISLPCYVVIRQVTIFYNYVGVIIIDIGVFISINCYPNSLMPTLAQTLLYNSCASLYVSKTANKFSFVVEYCIEVI